MIASTDEIPMHQVFQTVYTSSVAQKQKNNGTQHHIDRRLRFRIRLYFLVSLVMIAVVLFDVWRGQVGLLLAVGGFVVGCLIGVIASRMFHISWDEQNSKIVSRFDTVGIVVLVLYILFSVERHTLLGLFVHGPSLAAFTLSVIAGTMLGRAIGMGRNIRKILLAQGLHPNKH
jgi:uncharacterized membrane protein